MVRFGLLLFLVAGCCLAQPKGSEIFQMPLDRNKSATAKAATWLAMLFQAGISMDGYAAVVMRPF